MNISGLDRAAVLATLYNRSRPQGAGFIQFNPKPMAVEEAREILDKGFLYFDYLKGRVMKIDLSEDEVNTWGFNRDNGPNAAEEAIEELHKSGKPNTPAIEKAHGESTLAAAKEAEKEMEKKSGFTGPAEYYLGLSDLAPQIAPKVKEILKDRN